MKVTPGPLDVLIVGTPAKEFEAVRKRVGGRKLQLHGVSGAGLGVAYLIQHAPYELASRPDLIVLDADLGQVQDREFLQHLKRSHTLRAIPLVVLGDGAEVLRAYQMQANCQLPRPRDLDDWEAVLTTLEQFWTKVATLPSRVQPQRK